MPGVFIRREEIQKLTCTEGRLPGRKRDTQWNSCDDRARDCSKAAISQGRSEAAGRQGEKDSSHIVRTQPQGHLEFRLQLQTRERMHFRGCEPPSLWQFVLSQPQERNRVYFYVSLSCLPLSVSVCSRISMSCGYTFVLHFLSVIYCLSSCFAFPISEFFSPFTP